MQHVGANLSAKRVRNHFDNFQSYFYFQRFAKIICGLSLMLSYAYM